MQQNANLFDLTKKVEFNLQKGGISSQFKAKVVFAIDHSGSMQNLYSRGVVQQITDRVLALGHVVDDDGSIEVYSYTTSSNPLGEAKAGDFGGFVDRKMRGLGWGGTDFGPVLKDIYNDYYVAEQKTGGIMGGLFNRGAATAPAFPPNRNDANDKLPVMVVFITDGDTDDERGVESIIERFEKEGHSLYIQFIGIGTGTDFDFCQRVADKYGNCGFNHVADPAGIDDEQLFADIMSDEMLGFMKKHGG